MVSELLYNGSPPVVVEWPCLAKQIYCRHVEITITKQMVPASMRSPSVCVLKADLTCVP